MYMHAFSIFADNKISSMINSWNLSPQKAWLKEQFVLCSRRMRWLMSNWSWCQNWILLSERTSLVCCCFCTWDMMEMMSSSSTKFLLIIKLLGCIENAVVGFFLKPYKPKTPPANLAILLVCILDPALVSSLSSLLLQILPLSGPAWCDSLARREERNKESQMQLRLDCDIFLSCCVLFFSTVA